MASVINKSRSSRARPTRRRRKRRRKKSRDWVSSLFLKVIAIVILIGAVSTIQKANWEAEELRSDPPTPQFVEFDRSINSFQPEVELGHNFNDSRVQHWR